MLPALTASIDAALARKPKRFVSMVRRFLTMQLAWNQVYNRLSAGKSILKR
jgi:hypothetical protein